MAVVVSSFRAFLGRGLLRPFRRDQKGDFANGVEAELIKACVGQVLGTQCSSDGSIVAQGELPWRPEFGSLLYRLRHKKGFILEELARTYVIDALARWEPRVVLSRSEVVMDNQNKTLHIDIVFDIIDRNVPGNQVILSDVELALDLPLAA